ncbi:hypothetical protein R3P38DRAFT_2932446 [Favolaschia claudopus]|uniref:Secreted protein n=1 Tax=Favolaschia claudopus TaxID=2862362 RepID=A0AAW0BSQ3_9AGAR
MLHQLPLLLFLFKLSSLWHSRFSRGGIELISATDGASAMASVLSSPKTSFTISVQLAAPRLFFNCIYCLLSTLLGLSNGPGSFTVMLVSYSSPVTFSATQIWSPPFDPISLGAFAT